MLASLAFTFVEATHLHNEQTILTPIFYFSKGGTNASNNKLKQVAFLSLTATPIRWAFVFIVGLGFVYIFIFHIFATSFRNVCAPCGL